jgi:hypothetical protein
MVKQESCSRWGLSEITDMFRPDQIYHVTAMPCYDKKLEASRSDFYSSIYSTRDVDCVLTTGELDLLLEHLGFNPHIPVPLETRPASTDVQDTLGSPWPEMIQHEGSSSGSYLAVLLRAIGDAHPNPTRITIKEIRGSPDNVEYLLEDTVTHEVVFKGAKCYGFRNLQNLVRKVGKETGIGRGPARPGAGRLSAAVAARRRKAKVGASTQDTVNGPSSIDTGADAESLIAAREEKKLDFVEVMACPGGCVNGGGQMKPVTSIKGTVGMANENMVEMVETDEEGYPRPMADDGVEVRPVQVGREHVGESTGVDVPGKQVDEGMRWSTKEWVAKVEEIYWSGLPTPPPSPPLLRGDSEMEIEVSGDESAAYVRVSIMGLGKDEDNKAESMVRTVLEDVGAGAGDRGDEGVDARWEFLRTRYRKVQGDVLGAELTPAGVKW